MNAAEILKTARSSGLEIIVTGSKLSVSGSGGRPSHLLESIRTNKGAIIGLISGESAENENKAKEPTRADSIRYPELTQPEVMPRFTTTERENLVNRIMCLGKPAIGWCLGRANDYFERFPDSQFEDQDAAAAFDFLLWQAGFRAGISSRRTVEMG